MKSTQSEIEMMDMLLTKSAADTSEESSEESLSEELASSLDKLI